MADQPSLSWTRSAKSRALPLVIVAMLMIGEGVGIYLIAKAMRAGPAPVEAGAGGCVAGGGEGPGGAEQELAEVELGQCRPSNKMSGKFVSFQIRVSVLVPAAQCERVEDLVRTKQARLRDRINFVIRSAELKHLNEPGLETIKRRLKYEFDQVFNEEGMIQEVLIPELLQSGDGV